VDERGHPVHPEGAAKAAAPGVEGPLPAALGGGACPAEGVSGAASGRDPGIQPELLRDQEEAEGSRTGPGRAHPGGGYVFDLTRNGTGSSGSSPERT